MEQIYCVQMLDMNQSFFIICLEVYKQHINGGSKARWSNGLIQLAIGYSDTHTHTHSCIA